jgi:uncharacterized SAM-binding protein YcdF (DUF218 family)
MGTGIPTALRADIETLWDYHQMHHELHPVDVGVGLGSHDLGVATYTAQLYHRGLFPRIVFSGANAPTTLARFPRGEAIHYREEALKLQVPFGAVLVETRATNTGENIEFTRHLLRDLDLNVRSLMLVSRPYQQRRAYATAKKLWPEVEVLCASQPQSIDDYVARIGDLKKVVDMLVGDTQRVTLYAERGFAIPQIVPAAVAVSYDRLAEAGFTARII